MTMRDDYSTTHRTGDQVDVAPGVPTDRVRWGPILAGTFAALTALAVLSVLGAAIGMSAYDAGDNARNFAIGSGVWGIISLIIAFAFGGWLASRSAAVRGHDNGMLNGFMVAGVAIPLLTFVLGSAATLMSHAEVANNRESASARSNASMNDMATQAGATLPGSEGATASANNQPSEQRREEASRAGSRGAWSTLAGLVLAIGAASMGGRMGARDEHHTRVVHHHTPTGGNPTV
jgi:hypothetical protein